MYATPGFDENWMTADSAELTVFSDCARVTLKWASGAYVTFIEDTEALAVAELTRLGWAQ